jgi:hypothetical protein
LKLTNWFRAFIVLFKRVNAAEKHMNLVKDTRKKDKVVNYRINTGLLIAL